MNKCKTANTNILVENEKTLQDEQAIANTFIDYFTDVTHSLGLKKKNVGLENTLSKIVKNFRNSESVKKIKESQQAGENSSFSFILISEETYLQINLLFLVIFQTEFLSSMLRSIPKNWQIFLMNL